MRVSLKGVHTVHKKDETGRIIQTYHYAFRGGPRIDAEPGTPEFLKLFSEATTIRRDDTATLSTLIDYFKDSGEYQNLKPASQRNYRIYLNLIEKKFGSMPIEALQDKRARGDFKEFRDSFSANPRKADYVWTTIARVLSVAKDRGKIAVNVCERGGRLYQADRADKIWTPDDIRDFCAVASAELQAALLIALWTGQRQGDILAMTMSAYDGTHIRVKQGKGGGRVRIRAVGMLKDFLDHRCRVKIPSLTILVNSLGKPWTPDGFRTSWDKAFKRAKLGDLHFHDLRGTAVTRMALAGCSVPEIASVTGHSLKTVQQLLDAHYLGGRFELAELAMEKVAKKPQS